MSGRRRAWWIFGGVVGLLVLLLAGLVFALLGTSAGLRAIAGLARAGLPEGVTFDRVEGSVRGPFQLVGLAVVTPSARVTIGRIRVDWNLRRLLSRRLEIDELAVEDVHVQRLEAAVEPSPAEPAAELPPVRLPLDVDLRSGRIDAITIEPADSSAKVWVIDSVRAAMSLPRGRLQLTGLTVHGPDLALDLAADLETTGSYPIRARLGWSFVLPDSSRAAGDGSVEGDVDGTLRIRHSLSAPVRAELDARLTDGRREPRLDVRLTVPGQRVTGLVEGWPDLGIGGTLEAAGPMDSLTVRGEVRADAAPAGPIEARFALVRVGTVLEIRAIDVARSRHPAALHASGRVTVDGVPSLDVSVTGRALAWPLEGVAALRIPSGRLDLAGTPDSFRYRLSAVAAADRLEEVRVSLAGTGGRESADIDHLRLQLLGGQASASGRVAWSPEPSWRLAFEVSGVQPASLLPDPADWPGELSLKGSTAGRSRRGRIHGRVEIDTVAGTLRRSAIAGRILAGFTTAREPGGLPSVAIDTAGLDWGSLSGRVAGRLEERLDLRFALDAPDLSVAWPGGAGSARLAGELGGTPGAPRLIAVGSARDISFGGTRLAEADLDIDAGSAEDEAVRVSARIRDLAAAERTLDTLLLDIDGTRAAHAIRLRAIAPGSVRAALDATGSLDGGAWAGSLQGLALEAEPFGRWTLDAPAGLAVAAGRATLDSACLDSGPARLCAAADWTAGGETTAALRLSDLPVDRFGTYTPADWILEGTVEADVGLRMAGDGALDGELRVQARDGRLSYPLGDVRDTLVISVLSLDGGAGPAGASLQANLALGATDSRSVARFRGEIALPGFVRAGDSIPASPIDGRLSGEWTDLTVLAAASPAIDSITGRISIDATIAGSVAKPVVTGGLALMDGFVAIPGIGLVLADVAANARGDGEDRIRFDARASSGGGRIELSGDAPIAPTREDPAAVRLEGDRFLVMNTPDIRVWASPALQVSASAERVSVTGDVRVPRAEIELTEIPETAVPPSPDVVFVGDTATAATGPEIEARVRVVLGDSITFSGFGFTANPTGSLLVVEQPGQVTTGTGEVTVTGGRFRAYGQDLTLERGRVLFGGGPVAEPGLDMRAVRRAQDGVVAGLEIGGTPREPDVRLFSEPAMTQSEALSYVILGRPLGQASPSEGDRLTHAATSLGLRGGNLLASRIGARFGFQDVRLETEGRLEEASLVAGRYLTPRLYVAYGVGLFRPVSTYRVQYLLSSRWTLQAESGDATGADLLYRVERGK